MEHILIVDDEEKIREIIRKYAQHEGYQVTEAFNGKEAVDLCRKTRYDIVIMDIMMPELNGFEACEEIRHIKDIPMIMLSARGEEYDKIRGFELGVDDYVVKPFSPRELMFRVRAVLNRNRNSGSREKYQREGLVIDFSGRTVYIDGNKVDMTPREYELLSYLVKNRGVALTRERLLREVWGYDYCGDDRTLDTHIKLLRSSLGSYRKLLITLRGVGYRFEA